MIALVWILFRIPGRAAVALLCFAVAVSTFLLGIHWIADIVAGASLGAIAVWFALRINGRIGAMRTRSGSIASLRRAADPVKL